MKPLGNKGVALITALMFTLITLVIITGVISLVTQNVKGSNSVKMYRNVTEASYAGIDVMTNDVIPRLLRNVPTTTIATDYKDGSYNTMTFGDTRCIGEKKAVVFTNWTAAGCGNVANKNPKVMPDVSFVLKGQAGQTYTVYTKIVDTIPGVPFVGGVGSKWIGASVTDSRGGGGGGVRLAHYIYRVEVTAERTVNPAEQSNLSVLYEY